MSVITTMEEGIDVSASVAVVGLNFSASGSWKSSGKGPTVKVAYSGGSPEMSVITTMEEGIDSSASCCGWIQLLSLCHLNKHNCR